MGTYFTGQYWQDRIWEVVDSWKKKDNKCNAKHYFNFWMELKSYMAMADARGQSSDDTYEDTSKLILKYSEDDRKLLTDYFRKYEAFRVASKHARDIINDKSDKLHQEIEDEAGRLYRWFKKHNLIRSKLRESINEISGYDPVLPLLYYFGVGEDISDMDAWPLASQQEWKRAFASVIAIRYAEADEKVPVSELLSYEENRDMLIVLLQATTYITYCMQQMIIAIQSGAITGKDEIDDAQKQVQKSEKQVEDLKQQVKRLQDVRRKELSAAVVPLEQKLKEKDATIASLQEELNALRQLRATEQEVEADLEESAPIAENELLPVPEKGIIFVGGHEIFQAKLKLKYPEWIICPGTSQIPTYDLQGVMFLNTTHMNHTVFQRIKKEFKGDILYCLGTNLDILEHNMSVAYTNYMKGKNG